jgi:hypothetical protein
VLGQIVQLVQAASDQVRSIATASEQQSSASEEITHSIEEVSSISGSNVQAMSQANEAVSELARQIQVLRGLIGEMQVGALDEFLGRWRAEAAFISNSAQAGEFLSGENEDTGRAMRDMLKKVSTKSDMMEAAFVFDTTGKTRVLFNHGQEGPSLDLSERQYVKDALAGKPGANLIPFQSRLTGNFLVAFSQPVLAGGRVAGGTAISITIGANLKNYLDKRG